MKKLNPTRLLVLSFAILIAGGAMVLRLPAAAAKAPLSLVDAFFTSCSAVCVTGLIVVDTGGDLSLFGQAVVLALIQLGGLGIMTFSTVTLIMAGRSLPFGIHRLLGEVYQHNPGRDLGRLMVHILVFTLAIEACGAALLLFLARPEAGGPAPVWWAVFHSVSAFCNAGFSLNADSFIRWQASLPVNLVLIGLITSGGIGFVVLDELWRKARAWRRRRLSLHTRLALIASAGLIVFGAAAIWGLNLRGSLLDLPWWRQGLVALFQSVTSRTAGFNTIDLGLLSSASLLVIISLMFVGASPGSCGGGVKTTTLSVLFALVKSRLRAEEKPHLFKRTIPEPACQRAVALVSAVAALLFVSVTILAAVLPEAGKRLDLLEIVFEAVSAFGTVGLSLGLTGRLNDPGKILVMILMFVGRVGPLTLVFFIQGRARSGGFRYAEESVMIG